MTRGLTRIRRGTASTLKYVYNTRSHKIRDFILKGKEREDAYKGAKDKSNVEMWISDIAKSGDLIANLNKV